MTASRPQSFDLQLVDQLLRVSLPGPDAIPLQKKDLLSTARSRLSWHIDNSLSARQREVIRFYLTGKKEREIAALLGVRQQVVNIYKQRAIRKLRQIFSSKQVSHTSIK